MTSMDTTTNSQQNIEKCPDDGVLLDVECMVTKFKKDGTFSQGEPMDGHIAASLEYGVFSIRDMTENIMLSVAFEDALYAVSEVLKKAASLDD